MPVIFSTWQRMKLPRRQGSQTKQCPPCQPTPTRWPGFHCVTSSPTAVDASGNLVARNPRVLQSGKARLLHDGITVTDAAGLYLDSDLRPPGLWNGAFHYFEISTRFADLRDFHDPSSTFSNCKP